MPYTLAQEYELDQELFRQVLVWRGISKTGLKVCDRCGYSARNRKLFVVHHRHYRTFGAEKPEDVCLLCKSCHEGIHERSESFTLTVDDIPCVDPEWETMIRSRQISPAPAITPKCPICKTKMVQRFSARGAFWGCRNYPSCRGSRKINDVPIIIEESDSLDGMYDEFPLPLTSIQRVFRHQKYGHLFQNWRGTFRKDDKVWVEIARYADEEDARCNFEAQNEVLEWHADLIKVEKVDE